MVVKKPLQSPKSIRIQMATKAPYPAIVLTGLIATTRRVSVQKSLSPRSRRKTAETICLAAMIFFITAFAKAALPAGWSDADIGAVGMAGSAGYVNGLWTVSGGGSDIWGTA